MITQRKISISLKQMVYIIIILIEERKRTSLIAYFVQCLCCSFPFFSLETVGAVRALSWPLLPPSYFRVYALLIRYFSFTLCVCVFIESPIYHVLPPDGYWNRINSWNLGEVHWKMTLKRKRRRMRMNHLPLD